MLHKKGKKTIFLPPLPSLLRCRRAGPHSEVVSVAQSQPPPSPPPAAEQVRKGGKGEEEPSTDGDQIENPTIRSSRRRNLSSSSLSLFVLTTAALFPPILPLSTAITLKYCLVTKLARFSPRAALSSVQQRAFCFGFPIIFVDDTQLLSSVFYSLLPFVSRRRGREREGERERGRGREREGPMTWRHL